jgi:8-oxo-dGTP pyrophosphatase MutT (NUDIX family)
MFVKKVYAYVTNEGKLLVFKHTQYPEAGIQVPGGTVEGNETLREAVLREVYEETGLEGLEIVSYLGIHVYDPSIIGKTEIQYQHFFHLRCTDRFHDVWRHHERTPSDGRPGPFEFEFYWVRLPEDVPELSGKHWILLHKVKA